MTAALFTFALGFFFSFIGSVPPGTINLSILQVGLERKMNIALKFAAGAALMEYPYAWIAVEFASRIVSSPVIEENLQLVAAVVMTTLGVLNLWTSNKPSKLVLKFQESGFRRGLVLGVLNPMAIPFWVAMTAYLQSQQWIDLSPPLSLHGYLLGISVGAFALLAGLAYLAKQLATSFQQNVWLKKIPGIVLVVLGLYAFVKVFG